LIGLPLVPGGNQPIGILKHLSIGRTAGSRFLLGDLPALFNRATRSGRTRRLPSWFGSRERA
jgi:hypothetical protein